MPETIVRETNAEIMQRLKAAKLPEKMIEVAKRQKTIDDVYKVYEPTKTADPYDELQDRERGVFLDLMGDTLSPASYYDAANSPQRWSQYPAYFDTLEDVLACDMKNSGGIGHHTMHWNEAYLEFLIRDDVQESDKLVAVKHMAKNVTGETIANDDDARKELSALQEQARELRT